MRIHATWLNIFFIVSFFLITIDRFDVSAQVESWRLDPPTILTNILKDIARDGPRDEYIKNLREFIRDNPDSRVTDEALLRLADIYLKEDKIDNARPLYQTILNNFPLSNFNADAWYGLAYCQFKDGEAKKARTTLKNLLKQPAASVMLKAKAELLLSNVTSLLTAGMEGISEGKSGAIGVLLPLKGSYSAFGTEALKGILMASGVFGDNDPFEVIIKDTAGDPEKASVSVRELAANPNVAGIIGPLLSKTAIDAARTAQDEEIPIITLSQKDGLPAIGNYVFRDFLTQAQQVRAIADFAINSLDYRRFVVLYPENTFGRELSKMFIDEISRTGGEVLGEASYKEGKTDFGEELKGLFKIEEKNASDGTGKVEGYQPGVIADAIYIPDYYGTAGLIAPQLAYYDINVTMLGSNGWNSPKLLDVGGGYVEGAYFVDGYFGGTEKPVTKEFVKEFRKVYGEEPGIIEANAYDATMMLIETFKKGVLKRDKVRETLANIKDFDGVTGKTSFDDDGDAVKDLFILTVKNGRIIQAR